jgi:signal transduction histidine kinase
MKSRTLLGQIYASAASGVLVFLGLWTAGAVFWLVNSSHFELEKEADRQARELSAALAPLVWNLDDRSIQAYLNTKVENPEFVGITVKDAWGGHQWQAAPGAAIQSTPTASQRDADIKHGDQVIGTVSLGLTIRPREGQVTQTLLTLILSQLLLFVALLSSVALSWRRVVTRLHAMVVVMEKFSSKGESTRMVTDREDELGVLARGFNTMADRIQATTHSMEQEIQERTDRLMESEKLALVGSLVAGVAHEINTPVGNGITISSWLATRTKEIQEKVADSALPPVELDAYLADVESSLAILQSGLDRTSNLIQSFKKIGADQVVDERRVISLRTFLQEVVASLQPTLKRFPHEVVIDCTEDFVIENHPGALFQIVTNLVLNAHHHAFAPEQEGTITLGVHTASQEDPSFELFVRDDGAGMSAEVQSRIFQPFFTTKRQQGGTGLGLSIVHNLVQNLGGTIEVKSTRGKGSEFRLVLPKRAPDRAPLPSSSH